MKLFRRIAALALALVVVAMLGISASAASFRDMNIFGDFGTGAIFTGILTSKTITGTAEFIPVYQSNVLQDQQIRTPYYVVRNNVQQDVTVNFHTEKIGNVINHYSDSLVGNYEFSSASYYYDAYYIANGEVDCYLSSGPHVLTNP